MSSSAVQPLLALLASPVGGNPTQYMVEKAFAHHDLDWRYLTFEVDPRASATQCAVCALGFRGAHCAAPHRQAVIPLLDRTTAVAAMIGAVTSSSARRRPWLARTRRARGDGGDPPGSIRPARRWSFWRRRMARAAAVELAVAGVARLIIVNRTDSHAADLAGMLSGKFAAAVSSVSWFDNYRVPAEAELLIDAASIERGDCDSRLPIIADTLRPDLWWPTRHSIRPKPGCWAKLSGMVAGPSTV